MPFALIRAQSSRAIFQFVLPPSTMMSPGSPSSISLLMVCVVGSPAGTMIHITRGRLSNLATKSSHELAPTAPCDACAWTAAGDRSNATTRWRRLSRRRAMFPPMRPRPIIPSSIATDFPSPLGGEGQGEGSASPSPHRLPDRRRQGAPARAWLPTERYPQHRQPARGQRLHIADRLRLLQHREGERLAGNRNVADVLLHDLQKHTGLRTAFVELAGRVQEAWTVTRGGRDLRLVADRAAAASEAKRSLAWLSMPRPCRPQAACLGSCTPPAPSWCCPSTPARWAD